MKSLNHKIHHSVAKLPTTSSDWQCNVGVGEVMEGYLAYRNVYCHPVGAHKVSVSYTLSIISGQGCV